MAQARKEFGDDEGGEDGAEAGGAEAATAEEQADRKYPWSGEDRDYLYEELLGENPTVDPRNRDPVV